MEKIILRQKYDPESFAIKSIDGLFGMESNGELVREIEYENPPEVTEDWKIGAIVGRSGSGKSTVAKKLYGDLMSLPTWPEDKPVIACFGEDKTSKEISQMLCSVGFSSAPDWKKPYHVLSNGEKFRCDLAKVLLDTPGNLCVFDEFTSVVDRTVAKFGSEAVQKAIRRDGQTKKFVAVTCHSDILEWLQPDWVLNMETGQVSGRCQRRPSIQFDIHQVEYQGGWDVFRQFHYLDTNLNRVCRCYVACMGDIPVAFCAILTFPLGRCEKMKRISRLVVLPDYQGCGIGTAFLNEIARMSKEKDKNMGVYITTSNPGMVFSLTKSPRWNFFKRDMGGRKRARKDKWKNQHRSTGRPTCSFRYIPIKEDE